MTEQGIIGGMWAVLDNEERNRVYALQRGGLSFKKAVRRVWEECQTDIRS